VSKAVVQLEQWLGVGLLLRSTRSVVPTEAGRVFYERARRAIEEADEAVMAARGSANSLSGKLRVSTSVCFGRLHVIPYLSAFLAQHPNLDLNLVLDDRLVDLVNEGVDVALRTGRMPNSNMTAGRIAEGRTVVVATPAGEACHANAEELLALVERVVDLIGVEGRGLASGSYADTQLVVPGLSSNNRWSVSASPAGSSAGCRRGPAKYRKS
jgi:DNA-binding transcriptional LysR family regulator